MKKFVPIAVTALTLALSACKKDVDLPVELITAKAAVEAKFEAIDQKMVQAVSFAQSVYPDTTQIREKLAELATQFPEIPEFGWVTKEGILRLIEPATYRSWEGADIGTQPHVLTALQTKLPVLSNQFKVVEGFFAAVIIYPVVVDGSVTGYLTALFLPDDILESLLLPICQGQEFELWVMEKGGRMIYNQDDYEIGLDLFTDPVYADFPELLVAGHKIDEEMSGKTHYSFYKTGTFVKVTKLTYWDTFQLYGNEWKLVWVRPE